MLFRSQQYYVDLGWVGRESFRGDGGFFAAGGTDVYQGYDQYAGNGNMKGYWWFNLPSIINTPDRVDIYFYTRHWYYNSGGQAVINMTPWRGGGGAGFPKLALGGDWKVDGFPKPGFKHVTIPADWLPSFRNDGGGRARMQGITVGPGDGTNLINYGVFTDCRLNIWYTQ